MKLSLTVKISIKDLYPKNENISYNNFNCVFIYNNFNGKINLGNISNQNTIQHKVESFNSNIVYNIHLIDSNKNILVGISQLIINFDKLKNLNINDTLTQEEKIKLIIDSKIKWKIFDKNYNLGDIYLIILSEIKIIDKEIIENENNSDLMSYNSNIITKSNINYNKLECNLTPINYKTKEKIKSIKKDRESIKRVDTFSNYKELNLADCLIDASSKNSTTTSLLQKNKSLHKINNLTLNKQYKKTKSNNIDTFNRYKNINPRMDMPSPRHNKTNYNFNLKKEEKKKHICPKSCKKKQITKKKITILNLMEEKMNPILFKGKEENSYFEININNISKDYNDFKNTSINFSKIQINKINNNGKYSSRTLNKYRYNIKSKDKNNKNLIIKKNSENSITNKIKNKNNINKLKNKNKISVNIAEKNKDKNTLSSRKGEYDNEKEINTKKTYTKKLYLVNTERLNTDINMKKVELKNINVNTNLNSGILQTEITNRKLSEIKINLKKNKKKNILTDIDLEQLIIEKGASIKGNFHNNNYSKDKYKRGAFSPKLSLKFKFNENAFLTNKNDITDYKYEKDKFSNKYKEKINQKLLTPKGHIKKLNSFNNKFNSEENYIIEKDEIKKKYINLIDFYSLLSKKLKKTNKNNKEIARNNKTIKEKYNYLQKQKNNLIQKINANESIRIKNNAVYHFEQEQFFNKMINVKIQENNIYKDIFGPQFGGIDMDNKIEFLIFQKKEMMLNLIKNIVKYYGNITQIYNYDKNKKYMLKTLLNKYNIKEKVKIDLNYISYIQKENNFEDKIITEVDEDKENEEDEDEKEKKNSNNININPINNIDQPPITNDNIIIDNKTKLEDMSDENIDININNNKSNSYDENLNNLIKKILIEQFPENYKTNKKFIYIDKNKYSFENKIFLGYIENNDVVLKEESSENNNDNNKYTLNDFYNKYCIEEKKENNNSKSNFVYTKKIRQKYIKIKNNDKEQSIEKKAKNENSTTISDIEKKQQNSISRLNEMGEIKSSMSDEKETV